MTLEHHLLSKSPFARGAIGFHARRPSNVVVTDNMQLYDY